MASTELPEYKVIEKEGDVEIREYSPMLLASVTVEGERSDAINQGFRILAAFIFGENTQQQKVAMTAPVMQTVNDSPSAKIAMTAPVTQKEESLNKWTVSFMMPRQYSIETLPIPNDKRIRIEKMPPFKMAVITFSGFNTQDNLETHEIKLKNWLKERQLDYNESVHYAFYNPPWTLPFMKRNEVMFQLK